MLSRNEGGAIQISNRACHGLYAQDFQWCEMKLPKGRFQEIFRRRHFLAMVLNLRRLFEISVHVKMCYLYVTSVLDFTGCLDTLTNSCRAFFRVVSQVLISNKRNFDLDRKAGPNNFFE